MKHDLMEPPTFSEVLLHRALELEQTRKPASKLSWPLVAAAAFFVVLTAVGIYAMLLYPVTD